MCDASRRELAYLLRRMEPGLLFSSIAVLALIGLVGFVVIAFVRGGRKLPPLEDEGRSLPMPGPARLASSVCLRAEGVGDTIRCLCRDDAQAWAMVDGLEGHSDPEGAVRTIASTLEDALRLSAPWGSLLEGVAAANRALHAAAEAAGQKARPGACVAILAREGQRLHIGHAGLVRVYRVRGGLAELLTIDHSPLGDMIRMRRLPAREADSLLEDTNAPHRFVTSRAIGPKPDIELATQTVDLAPGDAFLVACAHVALFTSRAAIIEARAASAGEAEAWMNGVLDGPGMKPSLWGSRAVMLLRGQ